MSDVSSNEQTPNGGPVQDATGTLVDQTPKPTETPASDSSSTPTSPADSASKDQKKPDSSLANDGKPADEAKPAEGAPEKYEAFKAPEGFEFNEEKMASATELFKELNLSQDQAQKLVDTFGTELAAAIEEPFKAYQEMRDGWRKEIIADPKLGNGKDGLSPTTKAEIGRVIDSGLGPELGPKFREAMDLTGAGDHPAFVRGIQALAKFITEGTPVKAGGPVAPATKKPTAAQSMYPNLPSAAG